MKKSWLLVTLFNFLIASLMGLALRGAFIWEFDWMDYRNVLHGHSHLALLGWLYLIIFILSHAYLIPLSKSQNRIYDWLFWLTQLSVVGMMVSFPIQGYAGFSIFFATLHIVLSYVFAIRLWNDCGDCDQYSIRLLKTAIIFLVLSTFGVWAVAFIMSTGGRGGIEYQVAIQFYLHFQFNGWLLFAALALLVHLFPWKNRRTHFDFAFILILLSQMATFSLVLFWGYGWDWAFALNVAGVWLQIAAFVVILNKIHWSNLLHPAGKTESFLLLAGIVLVVRVIFQAALTLPDLAVLAVSLRLFTIGFIHLNMLGLFSAFFLFATGQLLPPRSISRGAEVAFWLGFVGTELYLFLQGFWYWQEWGQLPYFHETLVVFSSFLPLAVVLLMVSVSRKFISEKNVYISKQSLNLIKKS